MPRKTATEYEWSRFIVNTQLDKIYLNYKINETNRIVAEIILKTFTEEE